MSVLHTLLPDEVSDPSSKPNGPRVVRYSLLEDSLKFQAALGTELVYNRNFNDPAVWERSVGVYMSIWLEKEKASSFAEAVRSHFYAIDQVAAPHLVAPVSLLI